MGLYSSLGCFYAVKGYMISVNLKIMFYILNLGVTFAAHF